MPNDSAKSNRPQFVYVLTQMLYVDSRDTMFFLGQREKGADGTFEQSVHGLDYAALAEECKVQHMDFRKGDFITTTKEIPYHSVGNSDVYSPVSAQQLREFIIALKKEGLYKK
jgi:hypothetical protein